MARGHSPKGRLWGPRVGEPSDKISEGAEDSIPAPKFSGKGSVTLLQPKLFLVLSSCPQTFLECPYTLWRRALCWVLGTQGHRPSHGPGSLPSLAWRGWFAVGPAPDWGLPELGGILSGVEALGLEQCEAC